MSYQYYNERERTALLVQFDLLQDVELTPSGYPIIEAQQMPFGISSLRGFNEVLTTTPDSETGVHFFLDDYQFDRLWRTPERYIQVLAPYPLILEPDFSLYTNYPSPLQQWNHYRNQLLGAWMQTQGLRVIPTASWSDEASYTWCFDGLPGHATIAISTVGCLKSADTKELLLLGTRELIERKSPRQLLIYGKTTPELEQLMQIHNITWQRFAHGQAARVRGAE